MGTIANVLTALELAQSFYTRASKIIDAVRVAGPDGLTNAQLDALMNEDAAAAAELQAEIDKQKAKST